MSVRKCVTRTGTFFVIRMQVQASDVYAFGVLL